MTKNVLTPLASTFGFLAGKVAETQTIDANNNLATSYTQVDAASKTTYQVTQTPVSTISAENVYYNGLLVEEIGSAGETMRYDYDSLGRLALTIPQKTARMRTFYNITGGAFATTQISQTQFESADGTPSTLIAQYAYDSAGRVICTTDAYGGTTRNAYNCLGQLMHRWGSATQPVSYTYDYLGRLKTQSTYRDPTVNWDTDTWPASGAADTTTFDYYYDLPLALARTDAASKTTTWEYDDYARLTRATNARNQTIDYTYDTATGELLTKTAPLPDGAPATTTFTYNRAGQLSTVTDALGTRAFTYGGASGLDLLSETLPDYYNAGSSIHRQLSYDYETTGVAGRLNRVSLGTQTASDLAYTYACTAVGRIASITATPAGQPSRTFAYDYAPDAPWLMTGMHHATNLETLRRTIAYDEKFGAIKTIDTTWNNNSASPFSQARYDYTYDDRGMRSTAKQSGALYADYGAPTYYHYDYNLRGELLSARQYLGDDINAQNTPMLGRQHGYAYDAMGNRLSTRRTTASDPALDEHYETNNLNQIVSKENKSTPLSGTALQSASAYAAGPGVATAGDYQGRFWNIEMLLPNDTAPAKTDLALYFGKHDAAPNLSDAFTKQQRTAFQRQHTEPHDYDADGNLTADGLWLYTYDAENRLISMETHESLDNILSAVLGEPQPRKLIFTYDYLGRRVGKTVYKKQDGQWLPEKILKFAYDGWNLIAEYDALTSDLCPLSTSYVWGLDGAGSLTATAGVGALLMIQNGSDTYFPAYDGNGNVAGLLDKDGNPAAKYEYNPYGELTRVEGPYAHENPFRWSTKYTDAETGLAYYGLRYYSPRIGRFINRDPIGEQGGLNTYAFVRNNPVTGIDILGLDGQDPAPNPTNPDPNDPNNQNQKKDKDTEGSGSAGGGNNNGGGNNSGSDDDDVVHMGTFYVMGSRGPRTGGYFGGLSGGTPFPNANLFKYNPSTDAHGCPVISQTKSTG